MKPALLATALLALAAACAPALADPGIVECTWGGDDAYVTMAVYDDRRASLSGRMGASEFNCPLVVKEVRRCGPGCKILPFVTYYTSLDPEHCSVTPQSGDVDALYRTPTLRISRSGHRMYWRGTDPDGCTSIQVAASFGHGQPGAYAEPEPVPADLAAYVGRYPHDAVGGVRFLDHPLFRSALEAMPHDQRLAEALVDSPSVSTPIRRHGDVLHLDGCKPGHCAQRRWLVQVQADGSGMRACLADLPEDDGEAFVRSYRSGHPPAPLQGDCRPAP